MQYRNGHLVTAMASGSASDGFFNPKGFYYQVDVSSGTPVLLQQGIIDPGPGVSVQMPSVAEDINGNLGFSWMEASQHRVPLDVRGHPEHVRAIHRPGIGPRRRVLRCQFPDR